MNNETNNDKNITPIRKADTLPLPEPMMLSDINKELLIIKKANKEE